MQQGYTYKEVKAESFWGAIACLVLFQIFGYIILQAFVFYLDNIFMLLYGSIWLLVLLFFQSKCISLIKTFLSKKNAREATLSLRQIDDWAKFILTKIFIVILIFFFLGFYPFPQKEYDIYCLVAFFIFSWIISSIFSMKIQEAMPQVRSLKFEGSLGGGIVVGVMFILIGYFMDYVNTDGTFFFYLAGMAGLGIIMICTAIWLLQDQIK